MERLEGNKRKKRLMWAQTHRHTPMDMVGAAVDS